MGRYLPSTSIRSAHCDESMRLSLLLSGVGEKKRHLSDFVFLLDNSKGSMCSFAFSRTFFF